jgi:hypothetical protein
MIVVNKKDVVLVIGGEVKENTHILFATKRENESLLKPLLFLGNNDVDEVAYQIELPDVSLYAINSAVTLSDIVGQNPPDLLLTAREPDCLKLAFDIATMRAVFQIRFELYYSAIPLLRSCDVKFKGDLTIHFYPDREEGRVLGKYFERHK